MSKESLILLSVPLVAIVASVSFMMTGGSEDDPNEDSDIPVREDAKYSYNQSSDIKDGYIGSSGRFDVEVQNNNYKVKRSDSVPNPGSELDVKEVRVVGSTLVIEEEFLDTTEDDVAVASVVSSGGYTKSWSIYAEVDSVAVEHPYNDNPYMKQL